MFLFPSHDQELLKELYRTKDQSDINAKEICEDHAYFVDWLFENHKAMKEKHFSEKSND